jgi:hypothetical protein
MLDDARLIALWDRWKRSFGDEAIWETGRAAERTRAIEQAIAETPADGLDGNAIKLALWGFINRHDDAAALQANSALRDMTRFINRDYRAEALAVTKRCSRLRWRSPFSRIQSRARQPKNGKPR